MTDHPFPDCNHCKTIEDCPHPDVDTNFFGSPLPPDCCLRPWEIMRNTEKEQKKKRHD